MEETVEPTPDTSRIPGLNQSAETKEIYAALIQAQKDFKPVPKNKTATIRSPKTGASYTYKYADLADVLAMALPVLTAHGLGLLQPYLRVNGRLLICTRLIHSSGQWLMSDGINLTEAGAPQDFGADSTYYRRYDACSLLGIVADEDLDAQKNAETGPASVRQPTAKTAPAETTPAKLAAPQPASAEVHHESHGPSDGEKLLNERGDLINKLKVLVPDGQELGRKAAAMFPQHRSTKTLTVADLREFYESLKAAAVPVVTAAQSAPSAPPVPAAPPVASTDVSSDVPEDVAALFGDGKLTTAARLSVPTIGKGLAQRLHKLIAISKVHTEEELHRDYLQPIGLDMEHLSDLPRDLYERLCDWAEEIWRGVFQR